MLNWDSRVWQACVLGIWCAMPIHDPRPYCFLLTHVPSVRKWLMCAEKDSNGQIHVHLLALTPQRSDAFKRTLERLWPQLAVSAMSDIEEPDPTLEIVKCSKCHKPSSLLAYMTKDPEWIASSDQETLEIFQSVYAHDWGERFRTKQEIEKLKKNDPSTANMHSITAEITEVIMNHNCKSVEDCMRAAPDIIAKHLHRAGLATIIQNCIAWVTSTGGGWSLPSIATKYRSFPDYIHRILLHQGILPTEFDPIFYKWITKANTKHNTLVLWGPSNTGKSAFISGLKLCLNWGEVVNSNTFAFEGLINTQLGIWEEPLISPELAEKAKQIFEGMETSIPVKYRKPVKLVRIPILMTTNHAPWRFCTKEEDMFKNRMYIFHWEHNMHDTSFVCRASEHGCQCRVCKTSRISENDPSGRTTSPVQREKQPIQQLVQPTEQTSDVPAGSMPISRKETSIPRKEASGGDHGGYSQRPTGSALQRTNSSGSSSSTSSAVSDGIRSSRANRPSDPGKRDDSTESRSTKSMVSNVSRRDDDGDSKRARSNTGSSDSSNAGSDHYYPNRPRRKRKTSQKVVGMGSYDMETTWDTVQTSEPRLDREMDTLTIPSRLQWLMYLSYLQTRYG